MDKKIDEILYESLKPVNEPDPELNRQILDRRFKSSMRKLNMRKTVVAAAIGILVAAGGVSAYAASQNFSLLSLFDGESREVKQSAEKLLDTKVEQKQSTDKEQSQWANFKIKEAVADKNQVKVLVEVKAAEPEKYMLVASDLDPEVGVVDNFRMDGLKGEQTMAAYAKSLGKECLKVDVCINDIPMQAMDYCTEKDGTVLYQITFKNDKKLNKLDYECETCVYPVDREDVLKNTVSFTLKDNTDVEQIKYLPVQKGKVPGTDLIIDEVTFDKSDLEMMCNVKYHYAGKSKDWTNTKDNDICFYLLDSKGKIMKSGDGGSSEDGLTVVQTWQYSLKDLPDTISFQAKDVMEKKVYGTVDVKVAK